MSWRVAGTYLEACNCEAICPCRRIDGVPGGRSTYGVCEGALSWAIADGHLGEVDLSGLGVVLAIHYSDDEPGSPWTLVVYVDERGDERQRAALEEIFTGRLGGGYVRHFPWAFKPSRLLAVRPATIEIDHTPGRGSVRAGGSIELRVAHPYEGPETVTCIIPGHHQHGREIVAERLRADDGELAFEFRGRCGYETVFDYGAG